MKNIFSYKYSLTFILIIIFSILIIFSLSKVNLDPSLFSFLPDNKDLKRSSILSTKSSNADKVILFIEVNDENNLKNIIFDADEIINKSKLNLKNSLPSGDDIKKIIKYAEENSLLLYPYEQKPNPFSKEELKKRLKSKEDYLLGLPFMNPEASFFSDPLMLSTELLLNANEFSKGKYSTKYNGIVAGNNKSYIKILKAGFFGDNYKSDKELKNIDKELLVLGKKTGSTIFLFCSHFYFLESKESIEFDTKLVFILSIILILLIFYYFFQDISLLLFSSLPIIGGFALTFFIISIFRKEFGGITLAFGSTTIGIAIDYSINYLIRKDLYPDLKKVRVKIGLSLFLGFITTILAFVFLPFSRIDSLKEIAAFGIISISVSYLLSWYYLQNILPPKKYKMQVKELNLKFYDKKGFYAWVIILALFFIFLPFIKFEDNLMNLDMKHKELNNRLAIIQKNFNESSDNIFLGFKGKSKDEVLSKSLSALYTLKKETKDLSFFTPALLLPGEDLIKERKAFVKENFKKNDFYASLNDTIFDRNTFDPFIERIKNIDNQKITDIPEYIQQEFSSMFVNWNNDEYLLIPIYKRDVARKIAQVLSNQKIDFELIDLVADGAKGLVNFEKNGILLLLSSILIIYLLLLFVYKSFKYAFCSILPAISSLIICFGLTVILKNDFNIMHFVGCILIVGIGVDYGIFITNVLKEKSTVKEIKITIESNLICALSTLASFGVLALCRHNTLFSLGITMFAGILFSFLTSYLAVPYIIENKKVNRRG